MFHRHGQSRARFRNPRGFTLLEIVVVLLLVGIITGGAISFLVFSASERILRSTAGDIEVLAKRARTISLLQQKPYALVFSPGLVKMEPFAEATAANDAAPSLGKIARPGETYSDVPVTTVQPPVYGEVIIEDGLVLSIRRWASDKWIPMEEKQVQIWRFDPDGLCEPVTVRLSHKDNWIEDEYHPLTASVRDSSMQIK